MQALRYPNFILTPHVAWAGEESIRRLADQLIDNINAFSLGRRQHRLGVEAARRPSRAGSGDQRGRKRTSVSLPRHQSSCHLCFLCFLWCL